MADGCGVPAHYSLWCGGCTKRVPCCPDFTGADSRQSCLWRYQPPRMGAELIGWRCMATFPTGPQRQLRWQDGYVFESGVDLKDGKRMNNYRLFFPSTSKRSGWRNLLTTRASALPRQRRGRRAARASQLRSWHMRALPFSRAEAIAAPGLRRPEAA